MNKTIVHDILSKLRQENWEHRFIAAKRLSVPAGKVLFDGLAPQDQSDVKALLVTLLEDTNSQVRKEAAAALGFLGCREAVDALIIALADPNDWVRVQVAEAIGKLGNPFIAKALAQHLEAENEPHVRATLVKTLGHIGDETIAPLLMSYLDDMNARVRANCVEALVQLKIAKTNLKTAIQKLVNDPSNRVRANVAMSLLSIGEDSGREILGNMISSTDELMRASAAYAFGVIGAAPDRAQMTGLLGDPSIMVRRNAVKSLVKHGVNTLPEILTALRSNDSVVRLGALQVLAELKDPSSRPAVIKLLEDESGEVRSKAEEVLDLIDGF
jgi:HEAT repeat protein